jgi:sulfite oxidase
MNRFFNLKKISIGIGSIGIITSGTVIFRKSEKEYTPEEISRHDSLQNGVWVSYRGNVYDVTKFVEMHPGGEEKILSAAGSDLKPFWDVYAQHKTEFVLETLSEYRIGRLKGYVPGDEKDQDVQSARVIDGLLVHQESPFNAESLCREYITPNAEWYNRSHHAVPDIKPDEYQLEINGIGIKKPIRLGLAQIMDFPKQTVMATMQCGGNRRKEFNQVKPVQGIAWGTGAISNAVWGGVYLKDILARFDIDTSETKHIQFYGYDNPYDASVPINKLDHVFIAYEMNGEPLPSDHGYPVRSLALGSIGARSVKWLKEIRLADQESHSVWQRGLPYKSLNSSVGKLSDVPDISAMPSVTDLPIQSSIFCHDGQKVKIGPDSKLVLNGFAWSGGGRRVIRVEVSIDNGQTWHQASLNEGNDQEPGKAWAWTFWKADIKIDQSERLKEYQVICRAVDEGMNMQPEKLETIWNMRGILNNSWHQIKIILIKD